MKHFYYDVPPCPKCGSYRTGRYIRYPRTKENAEYMIEQSLKHGEIIRFLEKEPIKNAFCEDCGHRWSWSVKVNLVSQEYILKQIEKRKLQEDINQLEKEKKEKPKAGFFKRNFLW